MNRRKTDSVEISHSRAEGLFLKLSLGALFGLVLLVALVWGGHSFYVRWQEKRLIAKADAAMHQGDVATASLAARAIIQFKPDSAPAARVIASIAEQGGDQSALMWRRKVAQSKDRSMEDILALARSALRFDEVAIAKSVLAEIPEPDRKHAGFHAVAALVAQAEKQNDQAAMEWEEAVRLSPEEKSYQLQLASAELRLNDPQRRESGIRILNTLRSDPNYRAAATRMLLNESVVHHDTVDRVMQLARDLESAPDSTFADRVMVADLLRQANDSQFASRLTELEQTALRRPDDLAALLSWMSQAKLNVLANDFIGTLKPELIQAWPVPMAIADVYIRLNDWAKLEALVKSANWRGFDYLRHAYLARALRGQDKPAAAEREWSVATKGAAVGAEQTLMLLRAAAGWGWTNQETDLLWALTKYPDKEKEALQTLYKYYVKDRDSQGLYRVLVRLAERNPDSPDIQNNLAQISLLLGAKVEDARRTAAEVYRKSPKNPAYATTYAYALLTKGDVRGAAEVMNSLTEQQLKDPAVSAYYGICLAALNDGRARQFLDVGETGQLLPEEKSLIQKARTDLASHTSN